MHFEVNGKKVFAGTGGKTYDAGKPTVIFLHGSALDHTFWSLQSRFFAFRNYSVLALDFPGHGHSAGPCLASIEATADWLNSAIETLRPGNISLVGHSQGSLVALEHGSRFPQHLRSVSFIASGLAIKVNPALIEAAVTTPDKAIEMMNSWGFAAAGHFFQGPVPGNSMLGVGQKLMWRNALSSLATDLKACDAYQNGKAAAARITVPVQVMLGGQDRMVPRKAGMELAQHLKEPDLHEIVKSGHMLPIEAPDECRRLLRDFIFLNNPATQK